MKFTDVILVVLSLNLAALALTYVTGLSYSVQLIHTWLVFIGVSQLYVMFGGEKR